ncbi:MAG: hypothetical protein K1X67_20600 [Fimbriimonadaceae bacterium]|nr:hypothetical protein [Fimbriimonadaceae bacterium]
MALRFSDYFGIAKSQAELDFVDIPLATDMALFVDPFALSLDDSEWFVECNNLIVGFFSLVVSSIQSGKFTYARRLLANLSEPNDTRLGYSRGRPRGSGIGQDYAGQIFDRLKSSEAVKTGELQDLADAELVIPGIGRDRISDITTNIIRGSLIGYTQSQCELHGVPTSNVPGGVIWDGERMLWKSVYAQLPVYKGGRIVLIPKAAVRYELAVDHQHYYRHFVLEFLQAEHLRAGDALVTTLKNGGRRVYKKDLEKVYPLSKDFLREFSQDHPEVLEQYKASLAFIPESISDEQIEELQTDPRQLEIEQMIGRLTDIPPGPTHASQYHDFILGALTAIFGTALAIPKKELEVNEGRKRIDISFVNRDRSGFFFHASTTHKIHCPYVFAECKNYGKDVANPELDQLAGRFSDKRGNLGFLVLRAVEDKDLLLRRCRDLVRDKGEYILALDDDDIEVMLSLRSVRNRRGIDNFLTTKLIELDM